MPATATNEANWPPAIRSLKEKWPSAIVARTSVGTFSGGLLNRRTLANLDSMGDGPPRMRLGRLVCYSADDLCSWLAARLKLEGAGDAGR